MSIVIPKVDEVILEYVDMNGALWAYATAIKRFDELGLTGFTPLVVQRVSTEAGPWFVAGVENKSAYINGSVSNTGFKRAFLLTQDYCLSGKRCSVVGDPSTSTWVFH